ncbi:MAG: V-type ATP synthase subunit F [Oscillospiraceae bacterium]|nr:V-type ATP synthase subunit F [Oscillospiraceae bacterium]
MRGFVISDNTDTLMGMRLAGFAGELAHTREDTLAVLSKAMHEDQVAVVLITEKLAALCEAEVLELKTHVSVPLLVVIPDRHGSADMTAAISRYLAETVGIHI